MKAELKKVPIILLGTIIIAASLNFFLLPYQIASAGVGSIGYLLETISQINRNIIVWVINLIMLTMAYLFLERKVFLKTLIGSLLFPVVLNVMPIFPVVDSFVIALLIGSFLFSLGIFVLYQIGASNGGVTIPPLIFKTHFGLNPATGVFLTNLIIIFLNLIVFGIKEAVVSAISIYLISFFMKKMMQLEKIVELKMRDIKSMIFKRELG